MAEFELHHSPGACSRVSLIALEEAGVAVTLHRVSLRDGDQRTPAFRRLNPKGKVPVLLTGGRVLTETVAILAFLAQRFPEARLLPVGDLAGNPWASAQALSLLSWCSSGLHPLVTRLRLPQRFCDRPDAPARVMELARLEMAEQLAVAEGYLAERPWILGAAWSAADAYLFWIWGRCIEAGFDPVAHPRLADHARRMHQRPAVQRALRREEKRSGLPPAVATTAP